MMQVFKKRTPGTPGRSFSTGALASSLVEGIPTDPISGGALEGHVPNVRPTGTSPEEWAACSERILSAAGRKMFPVVFPEMSLSAANLEDVPARYLVGFRVSENRQSSGRLGSGRQPYGQGARKRASA